MISRRNLVTLSTSFLAIGLLGVGSVFWFVCPCERTPGGPLSFNENTELVTDWSFANEVGLCQLEVQGFVPWSVNLNCMASDKRLFVSCARCEGKYWSEVALKIPRARIAIGSQIYPVILRRVVEEAELDAAWAARAEKTGRGAGSIRADHWWSFELTSREVDY